MKQLGGLISLTISGWLLSPAIGFDVWVGCVCFAAFCLAFGRFTLVNNEIFITDKPNGEDKGE